MQYPTHESDDRSYDSEPDSKQPQFPQDGNNNSSVNEESTRYASNDPDRKPRTPYRSYGREQGSERSGDYQRGSGQYYSRNESYDNRSEYRNNDRNNDFGDNRYQRRDYQPRPYRSPDNYRQGGYGEDRPQRDYQPRQYRNPDQGGYRQNYAPRRDYGDRPQYNRPSGSYESRGNYESRGGYEQRGGYENRGYDNRRSYEGRPQYTPRRDYGDRPQYDRRDSYERRPRQFDDRGYGEQRVMRSRNYGEPRYQDDYRGGGGYYNNPMNRPITLVKAISKCDYGSPRICLRAIREGLVAINGEIVTNPNARVRMNRDMFEVNGIPVNQNLDKMFIAVHKGRHFSGSNEVSTPTIYRLMKQKFGWFAPHGCLEIASSGMIIYTNDINFKRTYGAELLNLPKTYRVKVHRPLQSMEEIERILDFVRTQTEENLSLTLERVNTRNCWLRIDVRTSTPTDIRTALKEYGLETLAFERTSIGHLTVKNFHPGSWRRLDQKEIDSLIQNAAQPIEPYIVPDDYKVVPPGSPVSIADAPSKKAWREMNKQWCAELRKNME